VSDRIKLWSDSLEQLEQEKDGLHQIDSETEKFYYPIHAEKGKMYPLNLIFLLDIHEHPNVVFQELTGAEKVLALRNEIYRLEYLHGMPENESVYFRNIFSIANNTKMIKIVRPLEISIEAMMAVLKENIELSLNLKTRV
jgi:hypothetical protein